METMKLTEQQRNLAATAVTILSTVVILAAAAGLLWLVALFVRTFSHVFLPLAVAAIVALVCRPYFELLHTRLRMPAPVALAVFFLSILIPLVVFAWFFGALLAGQVQEMIQAAPGWWDRVSTKAEGRWPPVVDFFQNNPIGQRIRQAAQSNLDTLLGGLEFVGGKALSAGADVLRGIAALFSWAVLPVYLVFFLLAKERKLDGLGAYLPFLKPDTRKDAVFLVSEFVKIIVVFFRGQMIIALLQGLLFAVGFSLVGLRFGFVIGLILGFLNIVPYLGSILGLGIALPLAYFQQDGGPFTLGGVLVVFTLVQTIEGYFLTPRIMGDRTGLHPMVIIVAIFFWGSALSGILGMILAIPLTAFGVVFWRLAKEKYIREWV
jgi:predicted PurR-regulated permease PerM